MTEKDKPKFRVLPGGGEGPPNGITEGDIAQANMRVVGGQELSAVERKTLVEIGESMREELDEFDQLYRPVSRGDQPLFQLETGLQTIADLSIFDGSMAEFIYHATHVYEKKLGITYRRIQSTRVYDGLHSVNMAIMFALPDGTEADNLSDLQHFIKTYCPSEAWEDSNLRPKLIKLIEDAGLAVSFIARRENNTKFIDSLRMGFIGTFGAGLEKMDQRDMDNLRALAWNDWAESLGDAS